MDDPWPEDKTGGPGTKRGALTSMGVACMNVDPEGPVGAVAYSERVSLAS